MGQCLGQCYHSGNSVVGNECNNQESEVTESLFLSHIVPPSEVEKMKRLYPFLKTWILDVLCTIETSIESDQSTDSMMRLEESSNNPNGWFLLLYTLVETVDDESPLGPAVISLVVDSCPLPSKDSVSRVPELFWLSVKRSKRGRTDSRRHRNTAILLGALAERMAGPNSVILLTEPTMDYLIANLDDQNDPSVILFSIIALEKFAQTSDNLRTIKKRLKQCGINPFSRLEKWRRKSGLPLERQVGFCAEWTLDNVFVPEDRTYSYLSTDVSNINAMLNGNDVSEYLKLSPDGLEARSDVVSFESARCTLPVSNGVWFYEVEILTGGIMQIGWATRESKFCNHEGCGIGDDEHSIAFDGFRKLIWHDARPTNQRLPRWKPGDYLGCLLDCDTKEISFGINGEWVEPRTQFFDRSRAGIFAAASFMSFQQAIFNFGNKDFVHPPVDRSFKTFNEVGTLNQIEKTILPRPVKLEIIRKASIKDDSCTLCCERLAAVKLRPCDHGGFCKTCSEQLDSCPYCRSQIESRESQVETLTSNVDAPTCLSLQTR